MGRKPSPEYSIERLDVNGNYTPENCVWADGFTQARNHRKQSNNTSGTVGVSLAKQKGRKDRWVAYIRVHNETIHLGSSIDKDEAVRLRKEAEERLLGQELNY